MTPFFSIISVQTNSYSKESVAVGLIVVADKVYFSYSIAKLNYLKKLDDGKALHFLAENGLKKIKKAVDDKNIAHNLPLGQNAFSVDYFNYLNQYAAGALTFSEPQMLNVFFDDKVFAKYYKKMIGESLPEIQVNKTHLNFKSKIKVLFQKKQIEEKADVDYILKADKFEGVLKNTTVSLITVNGSISCLQAIDLNIQQNTIINHIYEAQVVNEGLKKFGETAHKKTDNIKIAFEKPIEKEAINFFNKLYIEKKDIFDFYEYDKVAEFADHIASSKEYSKFSEFLIHSGF